MSQTWRSHHGSRGLPKAAYPTLSEAMDRADGIKGANVNAYACSRCSAWHVGNSNVLVLELGARAAKGLYKENDPPRAKNRRYIIAERFAHAKSAVRKRRREMALSHVARDAADAGDNRRS